MFEFLIDLTNIPSYQTIYITVMIGLMVKYFWDINLQITVNDEFIASDGLYLQRVVTTVNFNVQKYNTPILQWICKNIRKRMESSADDPEKPVLLLL
jgi:hypothetical protein